MHKNVYPIVSVLEYTGDNDGRVVEIADQNS